MISKESPLLIQLSHVASNVLYLRLIIVKQISDKLKPHFPKALSSILALSVTLIQGAAIADIDTHLVRKAAQASGLASLANVPTPEVENLSEFLKPGRGSRKAAIRLGKTLFWDMQVGSDGQACGSCHFHAGADSRERNQLSPGLKINDPALQGTFDSTAIGVGGPDYTLLEKDFPFHQLVILDEDGTAGEKRASEVFFDSNDVVSSMGVFAANFIDIIAGDPNDLGTPFADPVFNTLNPNVTDGDLGSNVRRVEPRNTPTMINAVFNHSNFWDGRAHNEFNGVSVIGPLDQQAMIWQKTRGGRLTQIPVRIPNSSLASQAVGPPTSDLEMSFFNRPLPAIGRKLMGLQPLGLQLVDPRDSVLGKFSRAKRGKPGISLSYKQMIEQAFRPRYWSSGRVTPEGYTLMEANFSLFFGLAIQMYESTLVSDQTPFDLFMEGDDLALDEEQLLGLLAFINRETPGNSRNSPEVDAAIGDTEILGFEIGVGNCISCHGSTLFSDATLPAMDEGDGELELAEVEEAPELILENGVMELVVGDKEVLLDNGFSNIGVRPTNEDPGRGGEEGGFPLAFVRQAFLDEADNILPADFELECLDTGDCPGRDQADGAFKVPGLRNVELTGPYFHNGGQATLQQVIEFYDRQGDFTGTEADRANIDNVDRNMSFIGFDEADEELLVEFLLALTDDRVRFEMAPFDHPQIMVPNGGTAVFPELLIIPAVGANGRAEPLGTFLDLEPFEDND
jgi:cytochrome c peroxidase